VSETDTDAPDDDWHERARELYERGGVPERRSEVVALAEQGLTNEEIATKLGLDSRGSVWQRIDRYRTNREESEWLAEYGPEL